MTNLANTIKTLRNDLITAWELRNVNIDGTEETCLIKRVQNSQKFFNSLDAENLQALKAIYTSVGYGSLLNYAIAIKNGKVTF